MKIPFNKPYFPDNTVDYISRSLTQPDLCNSEYTNKVQKLLENLTNARKVFLTNSCTAGLEMASLLANISHGDEVIMPSFTFPSTANAFVLRGATPVFVDIRQDTLNINESLIEAAITEKTKAIVPVHYAGVGCEMTEILRIAKKYNLLVIEDAAQGINAAYKSQSLGSLGEIGTFSFHYTKNITSSLGGAILLNDESLIERAKIIWEKGTNRDAYIKGSVDKYTWVDIGSSFYPSEVIAAILYAQLEIIDELTSARRAIWNAYYNALEVLDNDGIITLPTIPEYCSHNAHIFYFLLRDPSLQEVFINEMKKHSIQTGFHYYPLHMAKMGKTHARTHGKLLNTERASESIVRLPLSFGLKNVDEIIDKIFVVMREIS